MSRIAVIAFAVSLSQMSVLAQRIDLSLEGGEQVSANYYRTSVGTDVILTLTPNRDLAAAGIAFEMSDPDGRSRWELLLLPEAISSQYHTVISIPDTLAGWKVRMVPVGLSLDGELLVGRDLFSRIEAR